MGNKDLLNLPKDIYNLLSSDTDIVANEEFLDQFAESIKEILRTRLRKREEGNPLRFSSLGRKDRQIYFDAHPDGTETTITGSTLVKFLYGDLTEAMLLYLAKEAGYKVEMEQAEIEVDGVLGHIDAKIEGVIVDVKSASPYGYKKFETNSVTEDDPFGYVAQLAGYANVLTPGEEAAWVAFDKVSGDICVSRLSSGVIKAHDPGERITELKEIINAEEPPARCYEPVPDGKSGNFALPTPCSYCKHKARCHPNLRVFLTGSGPKFLTTVVRPPTRKDGSLAHEITKV